MFLFMAASRLQCRNSANPHVLSLSNSWIYQSLFCYILNITHCNDSVKSRIDNSAPLSTRSRTGSVRSYEQQSAREAMPPPANTRRPVAQSRNQQRDYTNPELLQLQEEAAALPVGHIYNGNAVCIVSNLWIIRNVLCRFSNVSC